MKASEIVEIKPIILGGSPTDPANKATLSREQHFEYVRYWNKIIRELRASERGVKERTESKAVEPASLRRRSVEIAERKGHAINAHLPLLDEDEFDPRPLEEVVSRFIAMHVIVCAAFGFDQSKAIALIKREGVEESLTPAERSFLFDEAGSPQSFHCLVEAMWGLAYVLGVTEDFNFWNPSSPRFSEMKPNLRAAESFEAFRGKLKMRPIPDLIEELDLAYCLHWACRQATRDREQPGFLDPGTVESRRHALEWVLSREDLDHVPMDT